MDACEAVSVSPVQPVSMLFLPGVVRIWALFYL